MKTIWRFELDPSNPVVTAPGLGRVLGLDDRRGKAEMWAEVDKSQPDEKVLVHLVATGGELPEKAKPDTRREYVGHLFHGEHGEYVVHVYVDTMDVEHGAPTVVDLADALGDAWMPKV